MSDEVKSDKMMRSFERRFLVTDGLVFRAAENVQGTGLVVLAESPALPDLTLYEIAPSSSREVEKEEEEMRDLWRIAGVSQDEPVWEMSLEAAKVTTQAMWAEWLRVLRAMESVEVEVEPEELTPMDIWVLAHASDLAEIGGTLCAGNFDVKRLVEMEMLTPVEPPEYCGGLHYAITVGGKMKLEEIQMPMDRAEIKVQMEQAAPQSEAITHALTKEQIAILEHTVKRAANRAYCGGGPDMDYLVNAGLMVSLGKPGWSMDEFYTITDAGLEVLRKLRA